MEHLFEQVREAVLFLVQHGSLAPDALVVLGCSTSEIGGGVIGKSGSPEVGRIVVAGALAACEAAGVHLAVQCCEHLNRALVLPRDVALRRGYPLVTAVPHPHAGGSCAAAAWRALSDPALVETIQAEAGIDIGDTLIGMHIRPVAVPLRSPQRVIGEARVAMAFTRPKYIGGPRARYTIEN